jgi:nitric oxide reductase activation protein
MVAFMPLPLFFIVPDMDGRRENEENEGEDRPDPEPNIKRSADEIAQKSIKERQDQGG